MADIHFAWWNLENLFDHRTAADRPAALQQTLNRELVGWTAAVRDRKIAQLASVIELMFGGAGPDILGVCEVENERVLRRLADAVDIAGRDYQSAAHESPDARGIDVSFIFDANVVSVTETGHQVVVKRTATRDIFWSEFRENGGQQHSFYVMANHWPARSAGQYASEPFRMLTGETVSSILEDLVDEHGGELPVLIVGDFNDEPFNRSMQEYLLGTRDRNRVTRARTPRILNLMWPLMADNNPGTYRFGSDWNMLDQFLATKGLLLERTPVTVQPDTVEIFRPEVMVGSGGRPNRFGRPSNNTLDEDGLSDHFPITVVIETDP